MSEFVRSFLAFDLENEEVKKKLTTIQTLAVQTGADLKLVEPENIHMTIRFLDDITLNMAEKIFMEMSKTQFKPFNIELRGIGVFPNLVYPRVLWVGIGQGAEQLQNIVYQIEPRIRNLGFQPDHKGFSPHITIARIRSVRNKQQLAEFVDKNKKFDFGTISAQCLRLKKSELTPRGPIYATMKEYCPK
jgi:RNA 2',3'-cyclic 3'-phosphodiesterase